jgi:hypothetical protein
LISFRKKRGIIMSFMSQVGQSVVNPFVSIYATFVEALPYILAAILILAFGFLLAELMEIVVLKLLNKLKVNEFLQGLNISDHVHKIDVVHILGAIVKWYIFVIFLAPAASIAGLGSFTVMLMDFARWVPHLIVGLLIVLLGWIGADILGSKIEATKIESKNLVSLILRTVIIVFVVAIALEEVGVNVSLLHQTFLIILGSVGLGFALALGIGFGLAMKDDAAKVVKKISKRI